MEIGEKGHSFSPIIFSGNKRQQKYFQEMQLFVLDFDDNIDYQITKIKCQSLGLPILFSYQTLSARPDYQKYRVVLCHVVSVKDGGLADLILKMLKVMFPEADKLCFEISRMFLGGKGIIEMNPDATFSLDELIRQFEIYMRSTDPSNYTKKLARFASKYGIALLGKYNLNVCTLSEGENDVTRRNSIKYIIEIPLSASKIVIYGENKKRNSSSREYVSNRKLEKITEDELCEKCRLYREFLSGLWLHHGERFLLMTNLINMKGKRRQFLEKVREYYGDERYYAAERDYNYCTERNYKPENCEGNCPYCEDCVHEKNICLTLSGRRTITKLPTEEEYVSLQESFEYMKEALDCAVRSQEKSIHLIYGQTGIGKTRAYMRLIREEKHPLLIAVPTVNLKLEIANSLLDEITMILSHKDLPFPNELREIISNLYERGLYREAKGKIYEYAEQLPKGMERMRIEKYLHYEEVLKKKGHVITTHAMLNNISAADLANYTIIVDEDILLTMLKNTKKVSVGDVKKALEKGLITGDTAEDLRQLLSMQDGTFLKSRNSEQSDYISKKKLDECGITGNINELFSAGSYHLDGQEIEYFVPKILPGQKIIIMSATMNEAVYRLFFNTRDIKVYPTPKVKYKGKVVQHSYYSLSRTNLKELAKGYVGERELFQEIGKYAPNAEYGISFKEYDEILNSNLHFGNSAGVDFLKGKDGMIIGTPHLDESCYKLVGCYLNISVNSEECKLRRQKVRYNGYEFMMMTYEEKNLRELQLYMISSELEQCIGRSRLLRTDATVYVFSNFPCAQAKLVQEDYLKNTEEADVLLRAHPQK